MDAEDELMEAYTAVTETVDAAFCGN
jgi:hypothetical protein